MFTTKINNTVYRVGFKHLVHSTLAYMQVFDEHLNTWQDLNTAFADVHPKDQYVKAVGRKIALDRLLKDTIFEPEARREFWKKYWSLSPLRKLNSNAR